MSVLDTLSQLGLAGGLPDPLPQDPFPLLHTWFTEAHTSQHFSDANAMVLATATADGRPSARVVLCKTLDPATHSLMFYTNYESRKAGELEANPRAACVFYWDKLQRQARVEGRIERATAEESDAYFASRPLLSRVGAWASAQSRPMSRRGELVEAVSDVLKRFGISKAQLVLPKSDAHVPRPPHWGGYRLRATRVELWMSIAGRLHDRAAWTRAEKASGALGPWSGTRLFP